MKNLTASDRSSLIRLAASLPVGDANRRAILAGLVEAKIAASPEALEIRKVQVFFETSADHEHRTTLRIEVETSGPGYWTEDNVEDWLFDHWREVLQALPSYTLPDSYRLHGDEDDLREFSEYERRRPRMGLGWVDPKHARPRDARVEDVTPLRTGGFVADLVWYAR